MTANKRTTASLRESHRRLHEQGILHDCRYFYRLEARTLYEELGKEPQLYPILVFTYHTGIWN